MHDDHMRLDALPVLLDAECYANSVLAFVRLGICGSLDVGYLADKNHRGKVRHRARAAVSKGLAGTRTGANTMR
jgi:hypothetical protein